MTESHETEDLQECDSAAHTTQGGASHAADIAELQVRRNLAEEMKEYRLFLQRQVRFIVWGLGLLLGSGLLFIKYTLGEEVSRKIIEYKIAESYKGLLEEEFKRIAASDEIRERLEVQVARALGEEIKRLQDKDSQQLIENTVRAEYHSLTESISELRYNLAEVDCRTKGERLNPATLTCIRR